MRGTPTLQAHESRFKENGWKKAVAWDMDTIYKKLIPSEEHARSGALVLKSDMFDRITKLEIFDEFEEWYMIQVMSNQNAKENRIFLQQHYCICIGLNDSRGDLKGFGFEAIQKE